MIKAKAFRLRLCAALMLGFVVVSGAQAHGEEIHKKSSGPVKKEQKPWGIAGDSNAVTRTINVGMSDKMRFVPERLDIKLGETIRFTVSNGGKVMHEFVLGTKKELDEHAALMKKFPDMEHDEPYMAHVAPGTKGEIVWMFNRAGEFDFACLLPGHYEAGMLGKIRVSEPRRGITDRRG